MVATGARASVARALDTLAVDRSSGHGTADENSADGHRPPPKQNRTRQCRRPEPPRVFLSSEARLVVTIKHIAVTDTL